MPWVTGAFGALPFAAPPTDLEALTRPTREACPVRWFRFADGYLGLWTDDAEFLARFRVLYDELGTGTPPPGAPIVRCGVIAALDPLPVIVCLEVPGNAADSVDFLLRSQGYRSEGDSAEGWRYYPSHARTTPAIQRHGHWMLVDRQGTWQWQVGNIAVNLTLTLQPELLFFHAAALALEGSGVLLMGESGRGKTSVALELTAMGHTFYSDEIGAVRRATRVLVPIPRAPMVRPPDPSESAQRTAVSLTAARHVGARPPAPLRAVVCLRSFARETRLMPFRPGREHLSLLTPLACCFINDARGLVMLDLVRLLDATACYMLDASSAESAARTIAQEVCE